jgi:hypothetical protein
MRARVHAEWVAKQEEQQVKDLMEGLKNGFRRKRRAGLLDDDVSLASTYSFQL